MFRIPQYDTKNASQIYYDIAHRSKSIALQSSKFSGKKCLRLELGDNSSELSRGADHFEYSVGIYCNYYHAGNNTSALKHLMWLKDKRDVTALCEAVSEFASVREQVRSGSIHFSGDHLIERKGKRFVFKLNWSATRPGYKISNSTGLPAVDDLSESHLPVLWGFDVYLRSGRKKIHALNFTLYSDQLAIDFINDVLLIGFLVSGQPEDELLRVGGLKPEPHEMDSAFSDLLSKIDMKKLNSYLSFSTLNRKDDKMLH